jgi:hypothetical protein
VRGPEGGVVVAAESVLLMLRHPHDRPAGYAVDGRVCRRRSGMVTAAAAAWVAAGEGRGGERETDCEGFGEIYMPSRVELKGGREGEWICSLGKSERS